MKYSLCMELSLIVMRSTSLPSSPPPLPSTCIIPILPTRICAGAAPCCYLYRIQTNWIVCTCVTLNILSDRESQWISEACWRTKSQSKWTHLCILYMKHISQLCAQRRAVGRVQKCRLAYSPDSWAEQSITPPMPEASRTKLKVTQTPQVSQMEYFVSS